MMHRYPPGLPVLAGVFAVLCGPSAFAGASPCPAVTVEADPSVSARWAGLPEQVRGAFAGRDDIDRCAQVALTAHDATLLVTVVLPDGRSASRPVSRRADVIPTLEALLLVPQGTEPPPTPALDPPGSTPAAASPIAAPPSPSPPGPPGSPLDRRTPVPDRDVPAPSPRRSPGHLRIELSVVTGARIGDGQTSVGLGALSFLEISGWLVGFEGRADHYRTLSAAPTDGGALELAVLGGRRFRFHDLALDLIGGPAAVMQGTATFETHSSITGSDVTESNSSTVPRLLLGTRLNVGAQSPVHVFAGIDGELGPARAGLEVPGASRLPLWTFGVALGATVGTQ